MFDCKASDDKKPDFLPFTLNMRLTTRGTARNLYKMLVPIIYARPNEEIAFVKKLNVNREQRQMAEDICNTISENVDNIDKR